MAYFDRRAVRVGKIEQFQILIKMSTKHIGTKRRILRKRNLN